jgi:hypothetical protein
VSERCLILTASALGCPPAAECRKDGLCQRTRQPLGGHLPPREREPAYLETLGYEPLRNGDMYEALPPVRKRRVRLS